MCGRCYFSVSQYQKRANKCVRNDEEIMEMTSKINNQDFQLVLESCYDI